jgi:hypothetical protein
MSWIRRLDQESPIAYLTRACGLADGSLAGLVFRCNGLHTLGLVPTVEDVDVYLSSIPRWRVVVPESWGPDVLETWLVKIGWSQLRSFHAPRFAKGAWHFSGCPPLEDSKPVDPSVSCFVYRVGDVSYTAARAEQRKRPVGPGSAGEPSFVKGPWVKHSDLSAKSAAPPPAPPPMDPAAPIQRDTPSQSGPLSQAGGAPMEVGASAAPAASAASLLLLLLVTVSAVLTASRGRRRCCLPLGRWAWKFWTSVVTAIAAGDA